MKHALLIYLAVVNLVGLVAWTSDVNIPRDWAYAAAAVLAGSIAVTFVWLHARGTTPLALGMAFSWTGSAGVFLTWWLDPKSLPGPDLEQTGLPLLFVAMHLVGAALHFRVIRASLRGADTSRKPRVRTGRMADGSRPDEQRS